MAHFTHKTVTLTGIEQLHQVVSKLATRNMLVVRGHPATDRQPIYRHTAHIKNHGDNGFEDVPKLWAAFDVDGVSLALPIDDSVARVVQPIYTSRPVCSDGSDPLAKFGIPLCGFRQGLEGEVFVPDNLVQEAQWARAEGHGAACASHSSADDAIRSIGLPRTSGGRP